jgi:maleate cis-trans isomerase
MVHIVGGGQISSSAIISGKVFLRNLANLAKASTRSTFNFSASSVRAINSLTLRGVSVLSPTATKC